MNRDLYIRVHAYLTVSLLLYWDIRVHAYLTVSLLLNWDIRVHAYLTVSSFICYSKLFSQFVSHIPTLWNQWGHRQTHLWMWPMYAGGDRQWFVPFHQLIVYVVVKRTLKVCSLMCSKCESSRQKGWVVSYVKYNKHVDNGTQQLVYTKVWF